jgi:hypothetical protein
VGARTLVFTTGDVGQLPEAIGSPNAATARHTANTITPRCRRRLPLLRATGCGSNWSTSR